MSRQRIRYLRASDGVRLAWAEAGRGPVLVKAANWLTHLEYEWESPVWRHWMQFFSGHFRFVRYDERGCGMSEWNVGDLSLDRWAGISRAVIDAAAPDAPVTLLGISQGAAVCIDLRGPPPRARRAPDPLRRLCARRFQPRTAGASGEYEAMIELARSGWGRDNPAFRQVFTSRFIPGGTHEQLEWFNDLCRKTTSRRTMAARSCRSAGPDRRDRILLRTCACRRWSCTRATTTSCRSRKAACWRRRFPDAEFVELDSRNHVLLEHEPAWQRFREAVLASWAAAAARPAEDPSFAALSAREREVLALMTDGLGNADIAERLAISEKTVRNHVSNVFDKLGVWSRAQAIVFARDRGFRARAEDVAT